MNGSHPGLGNDMSAVRHIEFVIRGLGFLGLRRLTGVWVMAVALTAAPAEAVGLGESTPIPSAYRETAGLYGIPPVLFYALALQESGRTVKQVFRPWPWTLNVAGEPYYYDTLAQMWDGLTDFVAQGRTHIGIGLTQVTTPYNPHVLFDVYSAIDPHRNLQMGAMILRERYLETRDWWTAVGHYHSPGKKPAQIERAERYRKSVHQRWRKLGGPLVENPESEVSPWAVVEPR